MFTDNVINVIFGECMVGWFEKVVEEERDGRGKFVNERVRMRKERVLGMKKEMVVECVERGFYMCGVIGGFERKWGFLEDVFE